ncbi:MAG: hypothetical protein Q4Q58_06630 [Thermoplasmata archaeon]|nr:hypothetical protein [Thermoplasmata archaeon]
MTSGCSLSQSSTDSVTMSISPALASGPSLDPASTEAAAEGTARRSPLFRAEDSPASILVTVRGTRVGIGWSTSTCDVGAEGNSLPGRSVP